MMVRDFNRTEDGEDSEEGTCKIRSKGGKRGTWKVGQFLQRARGAKNRGAEKGSETVCKSCGSY